MAVAMDDDPVAIAARLRRIEARIPTMSADEVDAAGAEMGAVQSWMTAYLAKLTARATRLQMQGRNTDAKRTAARTGMGSRDAARAAKRGKALAKMPEAMQALEAGAIGVGHADVLAGQADRLDGSKRRRFEEKTAELVAETVAGDLSLPAFEKRCREEVERLQDDDGIGELEKQKRASKASTWVDDATGMTVLSGRWDPLRGEPVRKALQAEIAARKAAGAKVSTARQRDQLAADALHGLITGDRRSKPGAGPSLVILIDYDAIVQGVRTTPEGQALIAETQGGRPLPVETVRRIACEAGILPIVLNGDSQPLDVGRERRLATRAQRMALRAQYPTCAMDDDCDVPFDQCDIHHVDHWKDGGRTDYNRMCPGCAKHHHLVHEGGWTLTRRSDGTWQLHPPVRPPP